MWGFPVLLFFDYLRCVRRADGEWRWNSKTSSSATNIHHLHMPCPTMVGSPLYCGVWKHCHNTLQYLIQRRTRYSTYLLESIKEPVLCLESVATSRVILTPQNHSPLAQFLALRLIQSLASRSKMVKFWTSCCSSKIKESPATSSLTGSKPPRRALTNSIS